jgi:4-aminobutyrate aminotransferase-like enzyme
MNYSNRFVKNWPFVCSMAFMFCYPNIAPRSSGDKNMRMTTTETVKLNRRYLYLIGGTGLGALITDLLDRHFIDCLGGYGILSAGINHRRVV